MIEISEIINDFLQNYLKDLQFRQKYYLDTRQFNFITESS